ncbi:hypothetical protein DSM112329_04055 [Paraconexibacter sp. AEG42_29]|uniref:DNA topoisomerase n=1 Tax=Paraconexibacter sp. AEG42_29 TaxID=2997339 RepID=A0AAU7AZW0_9ACTN
MSGPGYTRRRRGGGFQIVDADGKTVTDKEVRQRVTELVIPPAWTDVWIAPHAHGHIQATGVDAAGRRQYRYHDDWHTQQGRVKFREMEEFAAGLPALRDVVQSDLDAGGTERDRILAAMVRLLDLGFFRIGSEDYAEQNGSYGLSTMLREHIAVRGDAVIFDYPAKSGQRRVQQVVDAEVTDLICTLKKRRGGSDQLFAYKDGRRWQDVRSAQLNDYIKDRSGGDGSAKDFRTWGATVLCAVSLGVGDLTPPARRRRGATAAARKKVQVQAIREVARYLGNTPAVCRRSYVDPRVLDRHAAGQTIADEALEALGDRPAAGPVPAIVEQSVLELLGTR